MYPNNARIGVVQWSMHASSEIATIKKRIAYFVRSVASYQADFVVFPEFFVAPLMAPYFHLTAAQAARELASHSDEILDWFRELAQKHQINIITGSMPVLEQSALLNRGYVCHRDGRVEHYDKIHVTPDEAATWGMTGGETFRTFETDCGRIGVLICYDVEFPELSRLLVTEGMQILFVPFLTDVASGYRRVRYCAQARAIENECYVVISGCVGLAEDVHNLETHFAASAVFTPCDFAFPANGIMTEATPNIEMHLVTEVDFTLLQSLHESGSVRNLKDRRTNLYEVLDKRR
ncbi:MAG: carbon-nitrogen hydrolase family protein [Bacteroidetes Order II. Incertae sedis bacterium]|nr:carbon-nitrogen hydrolase family protein [Bacteroidetes Order II. bacterium]